MTASSSSTHAAEQRLSDHRRIRWTAEQLRLMAEMEAADPTCGIGATETPGRQQIEEARHGR